MPADDCRIRADCRAPLDQRRLEFGLALDLSARIDDVGENAGRTAEHAVLDCHTWIDADVVLKLAIVADRHVWPDHDVLANDAVLADLAPRKDMAEVPDLAAGADLDRLST